jgi:hypothetical protein
VSRDTERAHADRACGECHSGAIEADAAAGHLTKVTLKVSGKGIDSSFTTEYSGFGEPVAVTAPKV